MVDFFGKDFFDIDPVSHLKDKKLHFVHALLMKIDKSHYYRLFEFCFLIEKIKRNESKWLQINSIKFLSDPLRNILFELYAETLFEVNNVEVESNLMRGKQIVEGYCKLGDELFLYECKRKQSVISEDLEIKNYIATDIMGSISKQQIGFEFIVTYKIKENIADVGQFHSTLKRFKNFIKSRLMNSETDIECNSLRLEEGY